MSKLHRTEWGQVEGKPVYLYTLKSGGIVARVTNYGAILAELHAPDRHGRALDLTLGFDNLEGYLSPHPHFGGVVGRVANRIGRGLFALDGKQYSLAINNPPNHLHGGEKGFDKKVWDIVDEKQNGEEIAVRMTCASPDGEENYPGNLEASVTYALADDGTLKVEMRAHADAPTIVNLAHHGYWNLAGHNAGDVLGHEVELKADQYTPFDETSIPTGEIAPVAGTPFDFTHPKKIGAEIGGTPGGYDNNFVIDGESGRMRPAARVTEPTSGRVLEVHTTAPGVQFYTGNFLDGTIRGKDGAIYHKHAGFCLETQHFPDAINKEGQPGWPSVVLRPGTTYVHDMWLRFSAE